VRAIEQEASLIAKGYASAETRCMATSVFRKALFGFQYLRSEAPAIGDGNRLPNPQNTS